MFRKTPILLVVLILYLLPLPAGSEVVSLDGTVDVKRAEIEQMVYDLYCNPSTGIFSPCPLSSEQISLIQHGATDVKIPYATSADRALESNNAAVAGKQTGTCNITNDIYDLRNDMFRNYSGSGNPSCTEGGALSAGTVTKYVYQVDRSTSARFATYSSEALRADVLNNTVTATPNTDIYTQVDNGDGIIDVNDAKGSVQNAMWAEYATTADTYSRPVLCQDRNDPVVLNPDGTVKLFEGYGLPGRDYRIVYPSQGEWYFYCENSGMSAYAAYAKYASTAWTIHPAADTRKGGNTTVDAAEGIVPFNVGETDPYGRTLNEILSSSDKSIYVWKINNYSCTINWQNVPNCNGYVTSISRKFILSSLWITYTYTCSDLGYQDGTSFTSKSGDSYKCYEVDTPGYIANETFYCNSLTDCKNKAQTYCAGGTVNYCSVPDTVINTPFYVASQTNSSINVDSYLTNMCSSFSSPAGYYISTDTGDPSSITVTGYGYCDNGTPVTFQTQIR